MSNNKDQWDEVKEFQPERFLNDEGMFCKNENLLAFSTGIIELVITISNILFTYFGTRCLLV